MEVLIVPSSQTQFVCWQIHPWFRQLRMSARGYTGLHVGLGRVVKKCWGSCNQRQVTLCKWWERLSGSSEGEWTLLLIHNLEAWLERAYGMMDFYLTQAMSSHKVFHAYLFCMRLVEVSNGPTVIEVGKMMMSDTSCLSVQYFNCSRKTRWPPTRDEWGASFTEQSGHNHDIALTMGHKMELGPNAGPRHPLGLR